MGNSRSASRNRNQERPVANANRQSRPGWTRYLLWGGGLAVIIALFVYVIIDASGEAPPPLAAPEGTEEFDVAEPDHVSGPVTYPQTPPVGGPHAAEDVPCGYYDAPIPNELAVHTLEHGVIWITYSPDLAESEVSVLAGKAGQRKVLVSPYPDLGSPIVASAWGRQLRLDSASDARLDQFIAAFQDGAQSPEPFASC